MEVTGWQGIEKGEPPARFVEADIVYFALVAAVEVECYEPRNYQEAISYSECERWIIFMEEELLSLMKNKTWKIVIAPIGHKLVGC